MPRIFLVALAALAVATGCGYTLGGATPAATGGTVGTMAVAPLDNATAEPLLGDIVTRQIKDRLQSAGSWRLVNDDDQPDWRLNGRVTGLEITPMAFDADSLATEYRLELRAQLTLTRPADGAVVWSAPELTGDADYYANRDAAATARSKERAFHDAGRRLADEVAQQLALSLRDPAATPAVPPAAPSAVTPAVTPTIK
jgi:outer membrane lipopolysaccharide assembly protein LptE/RlpB